MSYNATDYKGRDTGPGLSRSLWADFNSDEREKFAFIMDDMLNFPTLASTTANNGYISYSDTGCTISHLADGWAGIARVLCDATGSDEEAAFTLQNSNTVGAIIAGASAKKVWFETRIKLSSVSLISMFVGLAEENCPADSLLADGGTGLDKDYVGFRILEADPDGIDAVIRTASGSELVVKNEAKVAVAATWYKLGFYYDGKNIRFYVDGAEVGKALATATEVPNGESLAPLFALKQHEAAEKQLDIDFWACGIER